VRRVVVNASPLIHLSKAHALRLLIAIFDEVLIPPAVYKEVVSRGLERGYEDAARVKRAVDQGEIVVRDAPSWRVKEVLDSFPKLDLGEAEVLALALELGVAVIVDEREARLAARSLGLEYHGTILILVTAVRRGIISVREALELLDRLVSGGFRLSDELLRRAQEELRSLARRR